MPSKKAKKTFQAVLGERICKTREKRGFTQSQLAQKSGIHRVNITQFENGQRSLPILALKELCVALNISLSTLLKGL